MHTAIDVDVSGMEEPGLRERAGEIRDKAGEAAGRNVAEEEARKRGLLPGQAAAGARDIMAQASAEAREAFQKKIERPS